MEAFFNDPIQPYKVFLLQPVDFIATDSNLLQLCKVADLYSIYARLPPAQICLKLHRPLDKWSNLSSSCSSFWALGVELTIHVEIWSTQGPPINLVPSLKSTASLHAFKRVSLLEHQVLLAQLSSIEPVRATIAPSAFQSWKKNLWNCAGQIRWCCAVLS